MLDACLTRILLAMYFAVKGICYERQHTNTSGICDFVMFLKSLLQERHVHVFNVEICKCMYQLHKYKHWTVVYRDCGQHKQSHKTCFDANYKQFAINHAMKIDGQLSQDSWLTRRI